VRVVVSQGLGIAFWYGWELTLVILSITPVLVVSGTFQFKGLAGFSGASKVTYEQANALAVEYMGNIRTVASFTGESGLLEQYGSRMGAVEKEGYKTSIVSSIGYGFANCAMYVAPRTALPPVLTVRGGTNRSRLWCACMRGPDVGWGVCGRGRVATGWVFAVCVRVGRGCACAGAGTERLRCRSGTAGV
jgi:hypothetical protein